MKDTNKEIKKDITIKVLSELTIKTRELSLEGIDYIRKTPMHKLAAGTAVVVIPGALTALSAYSIGRKIVKSYKQFKEHETNKDVKFLDWFTDNSKLQINKNISLIRNKSSQYADKVPIIRNIIK